MKYYYLRNTQTVQHAACGARTEKLKRVMQGGTDPLAYITGRLTLTIIIIIIIRVKKIIIIQRLIRRRNMSIKSLQGRGTVYASRN